jgi:HEAT repeat protein
LTTPAAAAVPERAALSRELANFLIELAIALQNHAVYPPGHPFLARSADAVFLRADTLLLDRGSLSFGVARDRLVIEGMATEPQNPVLSGLAGRLHRHRVGAVTLTRGITPHELAGALAALAVEAELEGPIMAAGTRPDWPNLRLHPLSFGNLELAEDGGPGGGEPSERGLRAPQLWIGLARAALASGAPGDDAPPPEPAAVAVAIDQNAHHAAYDQVIVGYLLQLAEELRAGGGRGSHEVRRRLSRMIVSLHPDTIRRLVEMGGDAAQRRRFVLDASHGFAADAVVRLVQAAAAAADHGVSHSLLRLLTKLAAHADSAAGPRQAAAHRAMREQVELLVRDWGLQNPMPAAYGHALDALARAADGPPASRGPGAPEPERIVATALEVEADGAAAWAAVSELVQGGRLRELTEILEGAAPGPLAEKMWAFVATPAGVRGLLRAGAEAQAALDRLCARMGDEAVGPLLDELLESDSRSVRRAALARLGTMGEPAAHGAAARLGDPRWFAARNLLALLGELGAPPGAATLGRFIRHADERVRREAFKLAFRVPGERDRALSLALVDGDRQVQRLGLAECSRGVPAPVLPLVCRRITDRAADPELRVLAVRVLGASAEPLALRTLLRLADGGKTLLGRSKLPPASPGLLAALAALASGWAADAEAARVLALARGSGDARLRAAAGEAA